MDYGKYIFEIPWETKEVVEKAIEIYKVIENGRRIRNDETGKSIVLTPNDKKCGALFLACLLISNQKKRDSGIKLDKIYEYLGIKPQEIKELSPYLYGACYKHDFAELLDILKNFASGNTFNELKNYDFEAKHIFYGLKDSPNICKSNIVNYFYSYANTENDNPLFCDHSPFEKLIQKLVDNDINRIHKQSSIETSSINKQNSEKDSPNSKLNEYGEFLTGKESITNPAIGREKEIRNLMLALLTPEKSAMIVGEAGVGKTAIVEGLAYMIYNKQVPKLLENIKIIKINTSSIVSGCMYVGLFEAKVRDIIKALLEQPNVILFIDEIHTAIGAGRGSNTNMDLANILKPYLDRGQIKMIGATTNEEYEKYIVNDSAFKRRFEIVNVLEPEELVLHKILEDTLPKIEQVENIKFDFNPEDKAAIIDAIVSCTSLNNRVHYDIVNNPDLSLTILKKSFAIAVLSGSDSVQIEHVVESIRSCERISAVIRNEKADELLDTFNSNKTAESKPYGKIIQFPSNR